MMGFALEAEMGFYFRFHGCDCRSEGRNCAMGWHWVWFLQRLGPT